MICSIELAHVFEDRNNVQSLIDSGELSLAISFKFLRISYHVVAQNTIFTWGAYRSSLFPWGAYRLPSYFLTFLFVFVFCVVLAIWLSRTLYLPGGPILHLAICFARAGQETQSK